MRAPVPDHVSPDVVVDFDYTCPEGLEEAGVYGAWKRLHAGPDIIWTPHHGGHWVLTRAEDIKWVQRTYDVFSHEVFHIPPPPKPMQMPPVTVDPPHHARYRALINPAFTPSAVAANAAVARRLARSLIADIRPKGECDFVHDFAHVMPVLVFLDMMQLPIGDRERFSTWATDYVSGKDAHSRERLVEKIIGYLTPIVRERMASRGTDLISRILSGQDRDRFASERELLGMVLLVFLGGLDTVANLLSFTALHLAHNPNNRRRLIEEPEILPRACEEIIRRHGLSNTGRIVKRDVDYKGVRFRTGDMVMVPIGMSSMDERVYPHPLDIDFDRPNAAVHNTFGNGPHACPGSQLARAELAVFLSEWLSSIPDFEIAPGAQVRTRSGLMNSVETLPLRWSLPPG